MDLHVAIARELDGRWIAEITDLAGVLTYGLTHEQAVGAAKVLALRVLADRLDSGELRADDLSGVHFLPAAA